MTICEYCHNKKMTKEEYKIFKSNIENTAQAIKESTIPTNGMYYPINDIINFLSNIELKSLIINELKKLGFEFIEDYTLYRV